MNKNTLLILLILFSIITSCEDAQPGYRLMETTTLTPEQENGIISTKTIIPEYAKESFIIYEIWIDEEINNPFYCRSYIINQKQIPFYITMRHGNAYSAYFSKPFNKKLEIKERKVNYDDMTKLLKQTFGYLY